MTSMLRRLWYRITQARRDADLTEEMETHRQLRQAQLQREGLAPAAAARASRRALGNVTLAREDAHDVWTLGVDRARRCRISASRSAVCARARRSCSSPSARWPWALAPTPRCSRSSTACCCASCRCAIRPALVLLDQGSWTYPIFEAVEAQAGPAFDGVFAVANREFDLSSGGPRAPIDGAFASGRMFDVLGVTAVRGRMLSPSDDRRDGEPAVRGDQPSVLAAALRRAPTAPSARRSRSIATPFTIVGVMPAAFTGTGRRPGVGRGGSVRRRTGPARRRERAAPAHDLVARHHGPAETGHHAWRRPMPPCRPCSRGSASARSPSARREFLEEPLTLVPAATGRSPLRRRFETPLRAMLATVGARAADRVRQPRQPDAGAGPGAAARAERPPGARRVALAGGAAARLRDRRDRHGGRRPRHRCSRMWSSALLVAPAGHLARHRHPGPVARLARAGVHDRARLPDGGHRRHPAGLRGHRRRAGRRDEGVGPDHRRRPAPEHPRRAGRLADRAVARPGDRRRAVPAHLRLAQPDAARLRARRPGRRQRQPGRERGRRDGPSRAGGADRGGGRAHLLASAPPACRSSPRSPDPAGTTHIGARRPKAGRRRRR